MTDKEIIDIVEKNYALDPARESAIMLYAFGVTSEMVKNIDFDDSMRINVYGELCAIEKGYKSPNPQEKRGE